MIKVIEKYRKSISVYIQASNLKFRIKNDTTYMVNVIQFKNLCNLIQKCFYNYHTKVSRQACN